MESYTKATLVTDPQDKGTETAARFLEAASVTTIAFLLAAQQAIF